MVSATERAQVGRWWRDWVGAATMPANACKQTQRPSPAERRAAAATRDPRERYVAIRDGLCEQGRLGRKTGAGYYSYADGKKSPVSGATVRQLIEAASNKRGIRRAALVVERV